MSTNNPPGASPSHFGLPEAAALMQLANEFFRAKPGEEAPAHVLDGTEAPQPAPANITRDHVPAVASALGLDAPAAYAAALPQVTSLEGGLPHWPLTPPPSPYYFQGETSAYQAHTDAENLVLPQTFALPGSEALNDVLAPVAAALTATPEAERYVAPGSVSSPYYFLDSAPKALEQTPDHDVVTSGLRQFDVHAVRRDFPILAERVNGRPLVWLDNAATTQKPQAVIDRLAYFYAHENSNIHRAAHELARLATDAYESARNKVARFIGAASADEIVFVRGATEAINLVAQSYGRQFISTGDEIILSHLEHHANIVPWQQLAAQVGAKLKVIPVDESGQILLDEYQKLLNGRTRLVALSHVSNALGTIVPVKQVIEMAHRVGARVLIDGAQAVSHLRVNAQTLDADFYVFSGHKVFAPTGIGVLYGKSDLLNSMPPWQGGGNMIRDVTFERATYQSAPTRFEAGTGNIADAVGLGAAIDYLERLGLENVSRYEHVLLCHATRALQTVPGLRLIGTARDKTSVLSFVLEGYRPDEVGAALNRDGIAVRAGHHCAQPILRRYGLEATVRPSLAFYNTREEVDRLVAALKVLTQGSTLSAMR